MPKFFLRPLVILIISALAFGVAVLVHAKRGDDFFYDTFYRLRPQANMSNAEVVLVAVDDASLDAAGKPWPWPRTYWPEICSYLEQSGAKVIAFDIIFRNPSYYNDDDAFTNGMAKLKVPVIYGRQVQDDGDWEPFAPNDKPSNLYGVVNLGEDKVYRSYSPDKNGRSSLAQISVMFSGVDPEKLATTFPEPFLLHYYGPHKRADGKQTFRYIPAYNVLAASRDPASPQAKALPPDIFKDKIVIVCAIALGAFDLKTSPLSDEYPGPEIQATAAVNMIRNDRVHPVPGWLPAAAAALAALLASTGIILPRPVAFKVLTPLLLVTLVFTFCILLFRNDTIRWFSPLQPLFAILIASPLAFGFTYFAEDRQRRFMLKALSKVVSPAIAEELAQNPQRLALGTTRSEITILFTDLANFTDLSEGMDVQDLGKFINRYLGEMSAQVFAEDGTLDKYIGDAVMCFWNAPLPQADHAARACRAALRMLARERELKAEFTALGATKVFTRIGINTSPAAVGFIGSEHLFNYTAMGDGINLASRMEGANKLYGTQILLSESTAQLVRDQFLIRRMDVLRVKGKKQPMPMYELIAEKSAGSPETQELIQKYEAAFTAYQSQQWAQAEATLVEISQRFSEDAPTAALLARVRNYRDHPPPSDWDGVYVSKSK